MDIVFGILFALAFCLCVHLFFQIRKYQDEAEHNSKAGQFWYTKWKDALEENLDLQANYDALDQGSNEIEENYQQELLDEYDKIKSLTGQAEYWSDIAEKLEQIRLDHDTFCLPQLGTDFYPMSEEDDTPVYNSVAQGRKNTSCSSRNTLHT